MKKALSGILVLVLVFSYISVFAQDVVAVDSSTSDCLHEDNCGEMHRTLTLNSTIKPKKYTIHHYCFLSIPTNFQKMSIYN